MPIHVFVFVVHIREPLLTKKHLFSVLRGVYREVTLTLVHQTLDLKYQVRGSGVARLHCILASRTQVSLPTCTVCLVDDRIVPRTNWVTCRSLQRARLRNNKRLTQNFCCVILSPTLRRHLTDCACYIIFRIAQNECDTCGCLNFCC